MTRRCQVCDAPGTKAEPVRVVDGVAAHKRCRDQVSAPTPPAAGVEYPATVFEDGLQDILRALPILAERHGAHLARDIAAQAARRLTKAAEALQ